MKCEEKTFKLVANKQIPSETHTHTNKDLFNGWTKACKIATS